MFVYTLDPATRRLWTKAGHFLFFGFGLVFCAFYSISLAVWATWGIIFVFENDL